MSAGASPPRVWVSRPLFGGHSRAPAKHFDVEVENGDREWSREQMAEKLRDKTGAILGVADPVDAGVVAQAPLLRVIANRGIAPQ